MDIRDRVAVVTGGASGVGRVIALALAGRGAAVLVADVDGQRCADAVAAIERAGGRASPVVVDVCDPAAADVLVEAAARAGPVGVLVNNAGGWGGSGRRFPDAAPGEWDAVLDLNLRAPMLLTQAMLGPMRAAGGGAVVNVASSAGHELSPYRSPEYGAAKAGLIRFTAAVAGLRETHAVRVNCVVPGWIGLERAHAELAAMPPEARAKAPPLIPPEHVSAAVVDLAEDDDLSGRVLVLRGGRPPEVLAPEPFE
ncbi:SDR family NAD(P)-dependent oxidoreductase [Jiangella mangrovi]|uniref:NAD(P)-dependent dehydrogenase (Short-subunit alcohol dehydrogenase family) n=1 Tax=Jiangella mangrovi TaxID=1524084 RepID=A0A7W9GU12_9ACTN|nr:SDR family NAD(P)-dependent oxidoreductase [Jiangella mangrovi]MBB5790010.1 NAD(P)-dependent dehydrogenase (short-subunit alcohol dehydrogenase family) [Jiangella mangrovi]